MSQNINLSWVRPKPTMTVAKSLPIQRDWVRFMRNTSSPKLAGIGIVVALLVAGCVTDGSGSSKTVTLTTVDSPALDNADRPDAPAKMPPGVYRQEFRYKGCLNPAVFQLIDKARLQSLLPPGFRAANASAASQFFGSEARALLDQEAGYGLAGFDAVVCGDQVDPRLSGLAGGNILILIERPQLEPPLEMEEVTLEGYYLTLYTDSDFWISEFRKAHFPPSMLFKVDSVVSSRLNVGDINLRGRGSIGNGSESQVAFEYGGGPLVPIDDRIRFWRDSNHGVSFVEARRTDNSTLGPILSCAFAPESQHARLVGDTTCAPGAVLAGNSTVQWTFNWLPNRVVAR